MAAHSGPLERSRAGRHTRGRTCAARPCGHGSTYLRLGTQECSWDGVRLSVGPQSTIGPFGTDPIRNLWTTGRATGFVEAF